MLYNIKIEYFFLKKNLTMPDNTYRIELVVTLCISTLIIGILSIQIVEPPSTAILLIVSYWGLVVIVSFISNLCKYIYMRDNNPVRVEQSPV